MKKIQKFICMLLLEAMLFTLLPMEIFAMSVTSPAQNVNSTKYFTALPGVYEMGDGYAVIWATSFSGTGYIKYTYGGVQYTVYDQRNNIVRTNDTVHVVKVPYAHLQGNRYTVYSTEVTGHNYAVTNYGTTISAGPIELKAYDGGVNDFDLLVLTDTHKKLDWSKQVASKFSADPDMVVFSGDIVDSIETKADIELLFNIMGSVTGGRYPIVYCRGNHETRGIYAANLLEYFPTKTGEFYFDFRYGPLWGVVMDTGEDKVDTHEYYGNLSNYKEYNQKQEAWLRSLRMDTTATYRLAVNHISQLASSDSGRGSMANGIDFTDSIGHLGIQFAVSGHDHRCRLLGQNEVGVAHATFIAGGYAVRAASWITLNNTTKKAYITAKKNDGTIYSGNYGSFNNYAVNLSSYVGPVPSALSEPDWGLNAQFNPTAASRGTISIAVPPTVFETGGDWYNIVWTTHSTSSTAKGSTGYVEYTYNGKTYQQFDEVGGYRRAFDTIHTVKVPKEHLNNNTYKVGSFLVEYSYTNPSAQTGRYYTAGDYVESGEYVFEFKADQKAVNLLAFPDIKTNNGDTSGAASAAWNSMNSLGTSPTYVVVNGDVLDVALYSAGDMAAFLCGTANVSGGHYPVIYSRGNSECRGAFATELIEYLPTATGEFYYTLPVGDYTFVNLDTAEDDPDNAIISYNGNPNFVKYGGRVFLDSLRKQQLNWINSLSSGKIVAISHIPFNTVKSRFGLDYESALKAKGAVLAIGGHDNTNSLKETVNASNIYTVVPGGFKSSAYTGSSILLSGDYAYINTCQYNYSGKTASTLTQKAVTLTSGQTCSYSASKPPLANGVYTVSTPGHLKWMAANATATKSFSGYTFKLANDIDMMLAPFTPIGGNDTQSTDSNSASKGFAGTFDGNGYTIRNLNIVTDNNNVGFFGVVRSGTVKNLTLSGGMVDGGWYVGGLAGLSTGGTFQNCYSDLMIYSKSGSKIGGLTGFLSGGSTVDRCANYGSVSARLSNGSTGGITGQVHGSTTNRILNTYNRGTVLAHGTSALAGGIFGYAGNVSGTIQNCYNAASVTSPGSKGTIAGSFSGSSNVAILNTYFVKGYNGAATAAKNSNSWSTSAGSGTVTGKSKTAMKSQAAAEALNADVFVYNAKENDGYPVHKNSLHSSGLPDHSYVAVVTAPTCTEEGYTTYTCECGDSYVGDKIAAKGHSYKTVTVDATCTKNGSITKTCTACGHAVTTTIPSTGHSYKAVVTAPTCDMEGYTTYTCACGNSYIADKVAAKGHSYTSVTVDPTCTQDGSITKTCTACGHAVTTTIPFVGHSYKAVVTAPTCTAEGYTTYTCTCGDSYVADKVAAKGHSYADGSCEICGNPDPDYIAPAVPFILVGDMNDWNENVHIMTGDTVVSVTMTLNAGNYRFKIRHGEESYGNDGVIVDSTASTSENGWLMRTSAGNCTLSASGGKYKFTFDTETDMLVITRQTNETEDAPISNGTITLKTVSLSPEDEILYNVYFTVADMTVDVEDLGLLVWDSEPAVPTINGGGTVIEGATYDPIKARYGIRTMGIPARDMGDLKYMVVYAKQADGSYVYSKVLQYSVKTYCLNRVQKTDDPNLRALCVAIMNYGAEAQKYFAATSDYTYTQLMNVGFEEYQDLVVGYDPDLLLQPGTVNTAKAGVFGTEKNGFSKRSVSMSAEGIFSLNYYFTPAVKADKVTFCYWTEEQYNSVSTLTFANVSGTKEMVTSDGGNVYWASVDGIAAKDLDQTVYACGVYEIDGVLYSTGVISYSLAKYCINKASVANDVQDLAAATVVYSYHAKAYFAALKALSADT